MQKRGFTLIELLVVIAIIAILASILFPIFAKAREQARKITCTSNVKQLATAFVMYAQDNNQQFPGTDGGVTWVSRVAPYVGGSQQMFACPSDTSKDTGGVSYGISGLMLRKDGSGVKDAAVTSSSEVGVVADATPTETYPNGRVLLGGALEQSSVNGCEPAMRHSKGCVVGFADGHAKYYASNNGWNAKDISNGAVRALISVAPLGLMDNPVGGMANTTGTAPAVALSGTVTVGGEYAAAPFLMAAALIGGNYYTKGFLGQGYTTGRPATDYTWGTVSGSGGPATTGIAFDALLVVVAKGSKIPGLPNLSNNAYITSGTGFASYQFAVGYAANSVQVYAVPKAYSGTSQYGLALMGLTNYGPDTSFQNTDKEVADAIANDPYGIGFIGSELFDPDRLVQVTPVATAIFPSASSKSRWAMTAYDSTRPVGLWYRSIDVTGVGPDGTALANALKSSSGDLGSSIQAGPLTKWGYYPGNY